MGEAIISRAYKNGDSVTIVQETGTSTTDVMSQNAVSTMYDKDIHIGARSSSSEGYHSIAIGENASNSAKQSVCIGCGAMIFPFTTNSIALGYENTIAANKGIAIGNQNTITGTSSEGILIGDFSTTTSSNVVIIGGHNGNTQNSNYAVVLGAYSKTTEPSTVSVGDGSSNTNYGTRRIINVKDPVNSQDVATKNYIDNQINNIFTTEDKNIYVKITGNDIYEGTESRPFKTIEKALSVIPKIINHRVTIYVGDGEFSLNSAAISGFSGSGSLIIRGNNNLYETKTKITDSLAVSNVSVNRLWIGNITFEFTGDTQIISEVSSIMELNTCMFKGMLGAPVADCLKIVHTSNCLVETCKVQYAQNGVNIEANSTVRVSLLTANDVTNSISAFSGSMVIIRSNITGVQTVYKQPNNGACIIYPNGTFNPD